jgi:hypothetical protein
MATSVNGGVQNLSDLSSPRMDEIPQKPSRRKPGPPKGVRYGGKQKGTKNKATIERELRAAQAQAVIEGARPEDRELAVDVLERMMKIAEGAASIHKPPAPSQLKAAQEAGQTIEKGDWAKFGEWFDRTVHTAHRLASFQSPTFRAIAVTGDVKDQGGRVRFLVEYAPVIDAVAGADEAA